MRNIYFGYIHQVNGWNNLRDEFIQKASTDTLTERLFCLLVKRSLTDLTSFLINVSWGIFTFLFFVTVYVYIGADYGIYTWRFSVFCALINVCLFLFFGHIF